MSFMFHTKLAGVTYDHRQDFIKLLKVGQLLKIRRKPDNPYDANAIAVYDNRYRQLGFLPRNVASQLAWKIDHGANVSVHVTNINGSEFDNYGVNISILVYDKEEIASHDNSLVTEAEKPEWDLFDTPQGQEQLYKFLRQEREQQENTNSFIQMLRDNFHPK